MGTTVVGAAQVADVLYADSNAVPATFMSAPATSDLEMALDAMADVDPQYHDAQQYYEGRRPEVFASIRLRRAMARTGDNFKINFAKKIVNLISERLEIASVTSTDPTVAALIEDLWTDNKLARQSKNITRRAGEYGDAYVMVWPAPDGDTGGDTDDDGIRNVNIYYNSPHCMRLFYDPENPLQKLFAIKKWALSGSKQVRVDLLYPDRIEKYISAPGVASQKPEDFLPYRDDDPDDPDDVAAGAQWPVPNPFGEIPVFHFRNDEPYGVPEHYDFYGVQDIIRKLTVSHMAGVDYNTFPQRYALTADDATTSADFAAGDEDYFQYPLQASGATSRPGDSQSQYSADPGALWIMQGIKGVGQFEQADPAVFISPMTTYLRFGASICDIPINRIDPTGAIASGEALRAMESPFVKKIIDRQEAYGDTWVELFTFALKILGVADPEVTVHWKSPATVDDQTGWQTLLLKLQAGLPPRQAFLEAGYTQDQVLEWFGEDDDDLAADIDLLTKIGVALQGIGAAASLGVLDDAQVQELIAVMVGETVAATRLEHAPEPAPSLESEPGDPLADDAPADTTTG